MGLGASRFRYSYSDYVVMLIKSLWVLSLSLEFIGSLRYKC